ncbi:MAG TPA: hypothetical protein PK685_02550 [archaeon]|jgi:ribonuclease HIII|nr:hypothetical protein [archaeon]
MLNLLNKKEDKNLTVDSFILDSCKATPGFEFYPKKSTKIDLEKLLMTLRAKNYFIEKDNSPFLIVLKTKKGTITIFSSLKIIIRDTTQEKVAKTMLTDLLKVINDYLYKQG